MSREVENGKVDLENESTATLIDLNSQEETDKEGKVLEKRLKEEVGKIKRSQSYNEASTFDQLLSSSISTATAVSSMTILPNHSIKPTSSGKKLTSALSESNLSFVSKSTPFKGNQVDEVPGALRILELAKGETKPLNSDFQLEEEPTKPEKPKANLGKTDLEKKRRSQPISNKKPNLKETNKVCELEFDYNLFLDQVRQPQALSIVRYLENFCKEFDKKTWSVHHQTKIVSEFTEFVLTKMLENPIFRHLVLPLDAKPEEKDLYPFDAAYKLVEYLQEGIEQYLMNRIHNKTFSPSGSDDLERDHVLFQRIKYLQWIEERHLDILPSDHNRYYLLYAQQELVKLNNFKTPRHKMICLLNCIKYIYGLLRKLDQDPQTMDPSGADRFLPLLIFVVLKANPPKLVSNLQYIMRFRHPDRLQSESGYYLTNLIGAVSFIESIEPASLTISKEEFEMNIEKTLLELKLEPPDSPPQGSQPQPNHLLQSSSNLHTGSPVHSPQPINRTVSVHSSPRFLSASPTDKTDATQNLPPQPWLAQKIKKPFDSLNRFFTEVTSPLNSTFPPQPDGVSSGAVLAGDGVEGSVPPKPLPKTNSVVVKKKSFFNTLFGTSSSEEEDLDLDEDEETRYPNYPTDQSGRPHPKQSLLGSDATPTLPPRRKSSLATHPIPLIQPDGLEPTKLELALQALETNEKVHHAPPPPANSNGARRLELPPSATISFELGVSQLEEMFPHYEVQVLHLILTEKMGNLNQAIEALLDMAPSETGLQVGFNRGVSNPLETGPKEVKDLLG